MTLQDVLADLESADEDLTIFAEGGPDANPSSRAVVALETDDGQVPPEASGLDYLLEVAEAREVLSVWRDWRGGREPSAAEKCEAVIHYAKHDAYLPV